MPLPILIDGYFLLHRYIHMQFQHLYSFFALSFVVVCLNGLDRKRGGYYSVTVAYHTSYYIGLGEHYNDQNTPKL